MRTLKALTLFFATLASFQAPAIGDVQSWTLTGSDQAGKECKVIYSIDTHGDFERRSAHLVFEKMQLSNLIPGEVIPGSFEFKDVFANTEGNSYSRVIGAPITIGGIGIVEASGVVLLDGQVAHVKVAGKGLWAWWSKSFTCKGLR